MKKLINFKQVTSTGLRETELKTRNVANTSCFKLSLCFHFFFCLRFVRALTTRNKQRQQQVEANRTDLFENGLTPKSCGWLLHSPLSSRSQFKLQYCEPNPPFSDTPSDFIHIYDLTSKQISHHFHQISLLKQPQIAI